MPKWCEKKTSFGQSRVSRELRKSEEGECVEKLPALEKKPLQQLPGVYASRLLDVEFFSAPHDQRAFLIARQRLRQYTGSSQLRGFTMSLHKSTAAETGCCAPWERNSSLRPGRKSLLQNGNGPSSIRRDIVRSNHQSFGALVCTHT